MTMRLFNFCVGTTLLLGIALGGNEGGLVGAVVGFGMFLTLGRR